MRNKFYNLWIRWKTKNLTLIPLFVMTFDYQKFQKYGKDGSCIIHPHPEIAKDEFLNEKLCECANYIRDNYDMEKFTKI